MDAVFELVLGLIPEPARAVVVLVLMALGIAILGVAAVIKVTPSKADDAALESIKMIPLLGSLLAWLVGKAPLQEKPPGA